jgi:hypothetical protein
MGRLRFTGFIGWVTGLTVHLILLINFVDGEERLAFVGEVGQAASGLDHAVQKHGLT